MSLFEPIERRDHEQVIFCSDKESGLRAIIAIHNTTLGPALGGARMWPYENDHAALEDALRLSEGMTYKAAISGLDLGGGKAVIIGDPRTMKSETLFRSFGRFIEGLAGRYITAEDVGTTVRDMEWVRMGTKYVTGIHSRNGGGDPSPLTAYGVYHGMKAAAAKVFGSPSLEGRSVAVQGAGNVAGYLVGHLVAEGANVTITDIFDEKVKELIAKHPGIKGVAPDEIYDVACDIFSPAALGGSINDRTIDRLRTRIVAGPANNQLDDMMRHATALRDRDILYIPDYAINAGGLINVAIELEGYSQERALRRTEEIYHVIERILELSDREKILTVEASNRIAEERIASVGRIRRRYAGRSEMETW
jgi:leucine dehydrogenase